MTTDGVIVALALLSVCFMVSVLSQGRWSNSWAAMAMPGLLVATAATLNAWWAPIFMGLLFAAATAIAWHGVLPGTRSVLVSTSVGSGVLVGGALAASTFASHLSVWAGPVVFAGLITAAETISSRNSPFGEWGLLAHSQARRSWAHSVGREGPFAVTAVLMLLSSAAGFAAAYRSLPLLLVTVAAVALLLLGWKHSNIAGTSSLRVVGLHETDHHFFETFVSHFVGAETITNDCWEQFHEDSLIQHQDLLDRTATAGHDADLVVWSEGAGLVASTSHVAAMVATAETAQLSSTYVVASWLVLDRGRGQMDNVVTVFDPAGKLVLTQRKLFPVPGPEAQRTTAHPPLAPAAISTPFGRLVVVICFDADHAETWNRVASSRASIVVIPASDWPAIGRLHADMALLRTRSVGAALIRPARYGVSIAANTRGEVITEVDHRLTSAPDLSTTL